MVKRSPVWTPTSMRSGTYRDRAKVEYVIGTYRPDVVVSTTGLPGAARPHDGDVILARRCLNNVVGTRNMAERHEGPGFTIVNVSTDKAVHPTWDDEVTR